MSSEGENESIEDIHELLANAILLLAITHVTELFLHNLRRRDGIFGIIIRNIFGPKAAKAAVRHQIPAHNLNEFTLSLFRLSHSLEFAIISFIYLCSLSLSKGLHTILKHTLHDNIKLLVIQLIGEADQSLWRTHGSAIFECLPLIHNTP